MIEIEIKKQSFLKTLSLYFEKRMARILLLGIIQGFPFVLIYTALTLWLRDNEFSRTQVGFIKLQTNKLSKITICIKTIQPLLWPSFFVKNGI